MSKTVRFAGVTSREYAEAVATDVLQKRQERKLKNDKSSKGKKKLRRRRPNPAQGYSGNGLRVAGVNRALLSEFIIFMLLQGFNLFSNSWVLNESLSVLNKVENYEKYPNVSAINSIVPDLCVNVQWAREKISNEINHFASVIYVYCFFLAVSACIFTLHLLTWLYTLQLSFGNSRRFNANTQETLIKMRVYFLVAASLLQDIPMPTISAELYSLQQSQQGLICWFCKVSGLCPDVKQLESRLSRGTTATWLTFAANALTSLWKGISSSYKWSRIDTCEAFYLRACTAVFSGFLYCIVILTPAMTVLKYRYFENIDGGFLEDLIDRIYIIGAIFWVLVVAVIVCCPLLNLIRATQ